MHRGIKSFPSVAIFCGALALFSTPMLCADSDGVEIQSVQARSYPRRTADLEKWLKREIIPGRTKPATIFSIFGTRYRNPIAGFDPEGHMRPDSVYWYDLDELGVHDHPPHYALWFVFDPQSGALLRTPVEEGERQTGFNINGETGAGAGP